MFLKSAGGYPHFPMGRQRGSALVIAIFVITVMSLLASALIRIVQDADAGLTQEVWGTRALAAANSGADAALAQLFPLTGGAGVCNSADTAWTPPALVGFHGCRVSYRCTSVSAAGFTQYSIDSTATCESGNCSGGDEGSCLRVSRSVEVAARD
ncbi:MSHA biogenesis protein MshP [Shewanella salipaludis]|uniref:MSHA biogenesis protein MshP n=1 Tax=Shewanella salipaludis TaxID=2723052 RepID=A0A972FYY0_9GAMM|nr:MSHA biogenesis protein MshP [Shewanella salipaludis]NMH65222.1 MSHA biogenesis protein MshP [Shewanella salipaludis]